MHWFIIQITGANDERLVLTTIDVVIVVVIVIVIVIITIFIIIIININYLNMYPSCILLI